MSLSRITKKLEKKLSSIGTCTYKMAKFLVPILNEYTHNEFSVKDSFSLAEEVVEQDASLYMTSFA